MAYSDKLKKEETVPLKKTTKKPMSALELMGSFFKNPSAMEKYEEAGKGNHLLLEPDETTGGGTSTATKAPAKNAGPPITPEEYKKMKVGKDSHLKISTYDANDVRYKDHYYKNKFNVILPDVPPVLKEKLRIITYFLLLRTESYGGSGDFNPYTTTELSVKGTDFDLTKLSEQEKKYYSGSTVFEFTRLKDFNDTGMSKDAVPCIVVKELGQESDVLPTTQEKQQHADLFAKYFTIDSSWTDQGELDQLKQSVARLPESILTKIPGLVFRRDTVMIDPDTQQPDSSVNGKFGMDGSITIYDSGFAQTKDPLRHGNVQQGFSTGLDFTIAHELGHALDNRTTLPALRAFSDSIKKVELASNDYRAVKKACENIKHSRRADAACKRKVDDKRSVYDAASDESSQKMREMEAARSDTDLKNDPAATPYAKASGGEGLYSVTAYGSQNIEENYAELFALYILDEERLKTIRPKIYAFFVANYPK